MRARNKLVLGLDLSDIARFKVKKVSVFVYQAKDYYLGSIIELPARFAGLDFLEPTKEPEKLRSLRNKPLNAKPLNFSVSF